ncbi:MAG: hypothetical protein ACYCW9_06290 [Thermoplasmata archaeon]
MKEIARSLTEQEVRVVGRLLEDSPEGERTRLRRWELPRSTYHHIRKRAYAEGWVYDRFIPDPRLVGLPWVSFLLVRPFADWRGLLVDALNRDPRCVHLVVGPNLVFSIHWEARGEAARRRWAMIQKAGWVAGGTQLTVEATPGSVPVYFDYEGLWSHLADRPGTSDYPRGLAGRAPAPGVAAPGPMTSHQKWAVRYLLDRAAAASARPDSGRPVGPFGLPGSVRRLLEQGWVSRRSILAPSSMPPYRGRTASRTHFVVGTPRPGARPEELFQRLVGECRVYPFLFAVGPDRWLIGAVGGPRDGTPPPTPRRPVLPTIGSACQGIEIFETDGPGFVPQIDHRYDRLLIEPASGDAP